MNERFDMMKKIDCLCKNGNRIEMIKEIQKQFGLSVKESKALFDEYINNKEIYSGLQNEHCSKSNQNEEVLLTDSINEYKHETDKPADELLNDYRRIKERLISLIDAQDSLKDYIDDLNLLKEEERKLRAKVGAITIIFRIIGFLAFSFSLTVNNIFILMVGIIDMIIIAKIGSTIDRIRKTKEKSIAKADEIHRDKIEPLLKEIEEQKLVIESIWNSNEMKLYEKEIPEEYSDLETMDFFIRALEVGRASTKKELMNLYEEHLHHKRLEEAQNKMLEVQKEQLETTKKNTKELEYLNKSQRKISRQVKYGNAVSTLDFLFKK